MVKVERKELQETDIRVVSVLYALSVWSYCPLVRIAGIFPSTRSSFKHEAR